MTTQVLAAFALLAVVYGVGVYLTLKIMSQEKPK